MPASSPEPRRSSLPLKGHVPLPGSGPLPGRGTPTGPPGWARPADLQRREAAALTSSRANKEATTGKHTGQGGVERGCAPHPRSQSSGRDVTWESPCLSVGPHGLIAWIQGQPAGVVGGWGAPGHGQTLLPAFSHSDVLLLPLSSRTLPRFEDATTTAATREPHSKVHVPNVYDHVQTPLCSPTARQTLIQCPIKAHFQNLNPQTQRPEVTAEEAQLPAGSSRRRHGEEPWPAEEPESQAW